MLITAVLEMASIGLILPVIHAVTGGESRIAAAIAAVLPGAGTANPLLVAASVFAGFIVVKNVALLVMTYGINRVVTRKMAAFVQGLFEIYLARPYPFHLQRNSAELLRNLNHSAALAFDGLRIALAMLMETVLVAAAFLILFLLEPMVTLGVGAILLVLGGAYTVVAAPRFRHWGEQAHVIEARLITWIRQSFAAVKDVTVGRRESYVSERIGENASARADYLCLTLTGQHVPRLLVETGLIVGFLAVLGILYAVGYPPDRLLATAGLFAMAGLRLLPSVNRILSQAADLRHRTAPIETLYADVMAGRDDLARQRAARAAEPMPFGRDIRLDGVSYRYDGASHAALEGIDLTIRKGESIGLVGASGAGKTTLVDMLLGLLTPTGGRLLIDGDDAARNMAGWQRRLGYVPQTIQLNDDTLRRNIAFLIDDREIDEDRVRRAAAMAHLTAVVERLPEGLDTMVGEQGVRLSGGERQRVGIARSLYGDPDVLVFDEATSALDNETEQEIAAALDELSRTKTLIIVAHRMSTVARCDRLILMDRGRIVDTGTFQELTARHPGFRRLVELGQLPNGGPQAVAVL